MIKLEDLSMKQYENLKEQAIDEILDMDLDRCIIDFSEEELDFQIQNILEREGLYQ